MTGNRIKDNKYFTWTNYYLDNNFIKIDYNNNWTFDYGNCSNFNTTTCIKSISSTYLFRWFGYSKTHSSFDPWFKKKLIKS